MIYNLNSFKKKGFQEVNRRIQTERALQDEINRLKRDLENSKRNQPVKENIRDRKSKSPPKLKNKQPML